MCCSHADTIKNRDSTGKNIFFCATTAGMPQPTWLESVGYAGSDHVRCKSYLTLKVMLRVSVPPCYSCLCSKGFLFLWEMAKEQVQWHCCILSLKSKVPRDSPKNHSKEHEHFVWQLCVPSIWRDVNPRWSGPLWRYWGHLGIEVVLIQRQMSLGFQCERRPY